MSHFLVLIAALHLPLAPVQVSPEDELKTVHTVFAQAATTGGVQQVAALIHPQALGFMRASQSLVQLKPGGASDILPALLADVARFEVTPYDVVFRVVGDSGVVAATHTAVATEKNPKTDKKDPRQYNRATYMYVREGGRWRLLSWHVSGVPLNK